MYYLTRFGVDKWGCGWNGEMIRYHHVYGVGVRGWGGCHWRKVGEGNRLVRGYVQGGSKPTHDTKQKCGGDMRQRAPGGGHRHVCVVSWVVKYNILHASKHARNTQQKQPHASSESREIQTLKQRRKLL